MSTLADVRPGTRFTFLNHDYDSNFYVADDTWSADRPYAAHHFYDRRYPMIKISGPMSQGVIILEPTTKEYSVNEDTNNIAKLELAADYGFQARFDYQGEADASPRRRTLNVEDFDGDHVYGTTTEGDYRNFRLDRIQGKVVIR